jgi:hypothetical protein
MTNNLSCLIQTRISILLHIDNKEVVNTNRLTALVSKLDFQVSTKFLNESKILAMTNEIFYNDI